MWKIGLGYLFLLVWCYSRAELNRNGTARPSTPASPAPGAAANPLLRVASWILFAAALTLITAGSGWNVIFWLPAGLMLTGLIQTLLPLRTGWR